MRLIQGLASSDATITQRLIVSRCIETDSIYIEYLPLPQVVTILDYQGHQKIREYPHGWFQ